MKLALLGLDYHFLALALGLMPNIQLTPAAWTEQHVQSCSQFESLHWSVYGSLIYLILEKASKETNGKVLASLSLENLMRMIQGKR